MKEQGIFYPCVPPSQYLSICTTVRMEVLERDLRHRSSDVPKHHREPVIKQGLLYHLCKHHPHWQLKTLIWFGSFIHFKLTLQEFWNIFKLGNVVLPIATVLLQQWEHVVVFITSMSWIKTLQLPEDSAPCFLFFFCVGDSRNRLATGTKMNTLQQQRKCPMPSASYSGALRGLARSCWCRRGDAFGLICRCKRSLTCP